MSHAVPSLRLVFDVAVSATALLSHLFYSEHVVLLPDVFFLNESSNPPNHYSTSLSPLIFSFCLSLSLFPLACKGKITDTVTSDSRLPKQEPLLFQKAEIFSLTVILGGSLSVKIRLFKNENGLSSQNLVVGDTKISTVKIQALRKHIQTAGNSSHREIYKKYIS